MAQTVKALPDDNVKEIIYHTMSNLWNKKMIKQGYSYLDNIIQEISGAIRRSRGSTTSCQEVS